MKKLISTGKDHTYNLPIFRELVRKTGIGAGDNLIFAGCEGTCYAMATYFALGLRDLNLNLYYAVNADANQLWRLSHVKGVGVMATNKEQPVTAKVIVLMSGLTRHPIEKTVELVREHLDADGITVGETVIPGLFEAREWDKQIPFKYYFEFEQVNPTSYEVVD